MESKFKTFWVCSTAFYDLHYVKIEFKFLSSKDRFDTNMPTFCAQINDKRLTKSVIQEKVFKVIGDFNAPLLTPSSYP